MDTQNSLDGIRLENLTVNFDEKFTLCNIDWTIEPSQHWVITGTNGSGKSALAAILAGVGEITSGKIEGVPKNIGLVSFEAQAELIANELKKDDADIMDVISLGTPVHEMIFTDCLDPELATELVEKFGLTSLMDRAFRKLSTGETRKVMLIRALSNKPDLLLLDEPFDGLDADTLAMLQAHLASIIETTPMIMVLNRFDEMPDFITHIAYMDKQGDSAGQLKYTVNRQDDVAYNELYQLLHLKTTDLDVPEMDESEKPPALDPSQPLVKLTDISIKYSDTVIVDKLNWTIEPGKHWQLSGPNGCGKTGILSLITGDHPQCYVNDIFVFGFQRGNGESIWQIKQYIGYVSTSLQWEYRVSTSCRNVIISGFFDSIGMYSRPSDKQKKIADEWLALLGMTDRADQPFNKLSYGDQRLLLIARAMVKHPPLLILDEPCLGLDDMNRQLVLALIEKICAGSETTVLYVNHHAEDKIKGIENYLAMTKNKG
ncbi:molybdate ABC transporter ATP-binding protein ModF [Marinomonas mediterranea]|jgi:ABC-type molybdenum transport system, ATPase component/photorepair protein PhrA|uniref:ABC transporter related protein n=1 Tax=Marinomonas mediterranea (strain ATCC 700492 / JCM 21426 / NBRC 103028 / MMB-1) TaxID=717774 RepID=F2JUX5_MARM1|nr:molybdate ABC transporter ATP-binding protein ModF [Marinomonas mediterranea]ADZ91629.1 ABC transporter related protein [Marinomonas mediterranea MMB-1]WCN09587.1 molybdate ABC transporter ATP-binding protein ModF [Marinomonas mediterranea]WCN17730.1 molybdate ABC transporter ATP-binding protein ModF [Marinomonas mediterranea MMB-1]